MIHISDEILQYTGTNPCPADFQQFWIDGVTLANSHNPMVEYVKTEQALKGVSCWQLFFDGVDGARIHAKFMKPTTMKEEMPVVFLFHGYTADSGSWWEKLAWIQQGFAVVAMDCRGQSGKSIDIGGVTGTTYLGHIVRGLLDDPKKLLYRNMFLDMVVLVNAIKKMPEIDESRMYTHGGSQGGALALICASLVPEIRRTAVLAPFLCDYQKVWEMDCTGSAYEEFIRFFRAHDPEHKRADEFFYKLGYIDVQNFMPWLKAEVLWGTGMKDVACPLLSQFAAYHKISARKSMRLFPDYGHENLPGFVDECFRFICE